MAELDAVIMQLQHMGFNHAEYRAGRTMEEHPGSSTEEHVGYAINYDPPQSEEEIIRNKENVDRQIGSLDQLSEHELANYLTNMGINRANEKLARAKESNPHTSNTELIGIIVAYSDDANNAEGEDYGEGEDVDDDDGDGYSDENDDEDVNDEGVNDEDVNEDDEDPLY